MRWVSLTNQMYMRSALFLFCLLTACSLFAQPADSLPAGNVFIITIDGLRWQELFNGADKQIINEGLYVADTGIVNDMYWDADTLERRRKLLPFIWNVVARKGRIYGNRNYGNKMNVANRYKFSYPGYSEMFTGFPDSKFVPNTPVPNANTNIFEFLNHQQEFKNKVIAFTSWDKFPYILNEKRSGFTVNSGYRDNNDIADSYLSNIIDSFKSTIAHKGNTRYDELTFLTAREHIKKEHPRVALIAFGEADEFAHHWHYDQYLQSITNTDRMIAELWYYVQTDPFYRNNTTFLITTDHGRGRKTNTWTDHLFLIRGSREIWMAVMGPGILPGGEIKSREVIYQKQIAATIANLLHKNFSCEHTVSDPVVFPQYPSAKHTAEEHIVLE